jgi:dienelactone hydrolase
VIFVRILCSLALLAASPSFAGDRDSPSPFIFAQSALAPAPSRGWVVLLPGQGELGFQAIQSHYEKTALLLNANGFDTLTVPYEEAWDDELDGEGDEEGDRIAAVTLRAVRWMHAIHPDTEGRDGAIVAWGEGAQGLWRLSATGGSHPLPDLATSVAFYPATDEERPFNSRVPMLVQMGGHDASMREVRRYVGAREAGSVEPDFAVHEDAARGFDVERFGEPQTVRSMPLIGTPVTFAYNSTAAHEAGQKMLTFLKARLKAPE